MIRQRTLTVLYGKQLDKCAWFCHVERSRDISRSREQREIGKRVVRNSYTPVGMTEACHRGLASLLCGSLTRRFEVKEFVKQIPPTTKRRR